MNRAQLYVVVQFILFAIFGLSLLLLPMAYTPLTLIVGVIIALIGVSIGFIAIVQFRTAAGRLPNAVPTPTAGARLVQSGLYRSIRHPIYTGVITGALGAAVAHGHLLIILLALAFIPFFTVKSHYEESRLVDKYPEYTDYMKRTGRFLPSL